MLLEYLHGTIATDFDLDNDQLGHVHRQLAAIIIELATHKFNKIGSLILDDSGDFAIGTDIETDKGPFNTALEFYNTISKHRFRSTTEHVFYDNLEAEQCKESLYLPFLFNNLMPIFTDCADDHGPFSLTNPDLGFHNILLDGNLNIVGMIDCDMVLAAPIHVVAQVSHLAKLERPPPGLRTRDERGREGYEKGIEQFVKFVEMLKTVEERFECGNAISEAFVSDAAALYRGLNDYRYEEPGLGTWHQSYLYMYYHKIKGNGRSSQCVGSSLNQSQVPVTLKNSQNVIFGLMTAMTTKMKLKTQLQRSASSRSRRMWKIATVEDMTTIRDCRTMTGASRTIRAGVKA